MLKKNPNWPPKGEVQSEQIYNLDAMTFYPEEIIEAIDEFNESVPEQYKGLLLTLSR